MMTTNFERCRSLHWGAAILNELLTEPWAPADLAERARGILPKFPDSATIAALAEGASIKLTSSQTEAIRGMRAVLEQLADTDIVVTIGEREGLDATLRHFPLSWLEADNAGFLLWPELPAPP
jgi:hypothetical protein